MKNQILTAIVFVIVGVLTRTVLHIGPNFETITAISILSGYLFTNRKLAIGVPIAAMFISDYIIGNSNIFLFTWSAYILMPLIGAVVKKLKTNKSIVKLLALEGAGLLSVVIFFLWTNFGVVVTTTMYEKSISGLITSYINALPFAKPQLISTVVAVPALFVMVMLIKHIKLAFKRAELNNDNNIVAPTLITAEKV